MPPRVVSVTLAAIALMASSSIPAAEFCVGSVAELQSALLTAAGNFQHDEIRVRAGTYSAGGATVLFSYSSTQNFDLEVSGGWNVGCSAFSFATPSVLDGSGTRPVMKLTNGGSGTTVTHAVRRLEFRNGLINGTGAGLEVNGIAANTVHIRIGHSRFISNTATSFGGGLSASSNGSLVLENSLFALNTAQGNFGAMTLTCNVGQARLVNNTITGNIGPASGTTRVGGVRFAGSCELDLANNIIWGNTDLDLFVSGSTNNRYHNDIEDVSAPVPVVNVGNVNVNPQFGPGPGSYELRRTSPLFNAGTASPPSGLALVDLAGRLRLAGGGVDIGALELDVLFYDGFQ